MKTLTKTELWNMGFHEVKHYNDEVTDCTIMRVHKGWIYTFLTRMIAVNGAINITSSSVFVPSE